MGNYSAAIKDYSTVIKIDPKNTHAYHNRGISYDKLGNRDMAIQDFSSVLQLDPTNANAYFNRGSALAVGQVRLPSPCAFAVGRCVCRRAILTYKSNLN